MKVIDNARQIVWWWKDKDFDNHFSPIEITQEELKEMVLEQGEFESAASYLHEIGILILAVDDEGEEIYAFDEICFAPYHDGVLDWWRTSFWCQECKQGEE